MLSVALFVFVAQVPTTQPMTSDFPVLMSETRQNNTEVRLSISQVSDKIDRLAEKVSAQFDFFWIIYSSSQTKMVSIAGTFSQ